ncbi:MAG TPA: GH25 family lysozyme [Solirubrobacterales bacterium]
MKAMVDVSEHNGSVDWKKVAGRMGGAYVRVADGDHRDSTYGPERVAEIRANKLIWGPYYFARVASAQNGQRNGTAEAKMAIEFARSGGWPKAGDLPLAYDFETLNQQTAAKAARHVGQFVRAYSKEMAHLPVIYTMPGMWPVVERELSPRDRAFISRCPLWVAHWGVRQPTVPEPWESYSIWQDTDHASCSGVRGACDHSKVGVALSKLTIRGQSKEKPPGAQPELLGTEEATAPAGKPKGKKKGAAAKAKKAQASAGGLPDWLPQQHVKLWKFPWSAKARGSTAFKKILLEHGYLSPNFTLDEARCHDPARTAVPGNLKANAQRQAFNLEILRHELGDKPIAILSWYRTPAWNQHVGGASQSRHMQADATDFDVQLVDSFGASVFDKDADKVYARGGFGTYPSGSRHTDSRGSRARWSSF